VPTVALRERELLRRLGWLIEVRWVFVAVLAVAAWTGGSLVRADFPVARTFAVAGLVATYNAMLLAHHRLVRRGAVPDLATSRLEAGLQIGLDLLALTALVHFGGGARSPFVGFYLFHGVVASMLLPRRSALLVGLAAFALFLVVVVLESQRILPHYPGVGRAGLGGARPGDGTAALACLTLLATLFGTISISCAIVQRIHRGERLLVEAREGLLRKSADLERAYGELRDKQRRLVETERQASLGVLVSGIAHEINNPIQFINGNMAILAEAFSDLLPLVDAQRAEDPGLRIARLEVGFLREQVPVLLRDMADGAARIERIVRDLKSYARKDGGRLDLDVDLNQAVQASVRLLHPQLKHLRVEEELDLNLPHLRGNPTQLQQVVVHTLQNAADALGRVPHGTIRIRTRAEGNGCRVRLSIEDNGSVERPEVRHPEATIAGSDEGAGPGPLGLAIACGIVQQHHGRVEIEAHAGRGTALHFVLPAAAAVAG
jgi:signal transduction histidine kinase